jgi:hypothetical protein
MGGVSTLGGGFAQGLLRVVWKRWEMGEGWEQWREGFPIVLKPAGEI